MKSNVKSNGTLPFYPPTYTIFFLPRPLGAGGVQRSREGVVDLGSLSTVVAHQTPPPPSTFARATADKVGYSPGPNAEGEE